MSSQELVAAYVAGRVSRRTLIRRLVAGGVSVGAAVSYAHLLAPERAGAAQRRGVTPPEYPEEYPQPIQFPQLVLKVASRDIRDVRRDGKLKVKIRAFDEGGSLRLHAFGPRTGAPEWALMGSKSVDLPGPDTKTVNIKLSNVTPLQGTNRAKVAVTAVSAEIGNDPKVAETYSILKRT